MAYYTYPNGETYNFTFTPTGSDARKVSNAEGKRLRAEYCRKQLQAMLPEGATIYTVLRHCSASGMSRRVSLLVIADGQLRSIDALAADLMGDKVSDKGGIVVGGCGFDAGFHLVYNLACGVRPDATRRGYSFKHEWV